MNGMNTYIACLVAMVLTMPFSTSWGQDKGRWCSEVFPGWQSLIAANANVGVECDGNLSGQLADDTPIRTITIRMRPDGPDGTDRYVTFNPKGLTANDMNVQAPNRAAKMKHLLDEYLVASAMKKSPAMGFIDVVAVKIDSSVKLYQDVTGKEPALAEPDKAIPQFDSKKPLAKEMACMANLKKIPGFRNTRMTFDMGGDGAQPVLVYSGYKHDQKTSDVIYTLDGWFFTDYNPDDRYPSEHYVELQGNKDYPQTRWLYTEYSERSRGQPIIYSKPQKDMRPQKKVLKTDVPEFGRASDMTKLLHSQIVESTQRIKKEFDANPRLRSETNQELISNAIASCKKIENVYAEIESFDNHVFPKSDAGNNDGKSGVKR